MPQPEIERRYIALDVAELRVERKEGKSPVVSGYAAVFNRDSVDMGGWKERIAPGAFTDCLKDNPDVRMLFNHDPNLVLARTKSGTLRLEQNTRGLKISADMPDTQLGRDLIVSMERGDVDQMSFAFTVAEGGQEWSPDFSQRTVTRCATLYDVAPVTYAAYPDTSIAVRSRDAAKRSAEPTAAPKPAADDDAERKAIERIERYEARERERIRKQVLG